MLKFLKTIFGLRNKRKEPMSPSEELELREQMRMIQEQTKRKTHNFGNAGGLNLPYDFNRGFGGKAINDHLIRGPKDNP